VNDDVARISESTLGTELSTEQAAALAGLMATRELADGDFLLTEGTADDQLHLIVEGKLEVVKNTGAGETASLAVLRAGELAGELGFLDGAPHEVGLRALCRSRVLSLSRADFERIVDDDPQLVYRFMRAIARSVHRTMHRMNSEFVELRNYVFKQHGRY